MNEIKLYGGKVTLKYEEYRHRYVLDGKTVPSVSSVLKVIDKPALLSWASRITAEYIEEHLPVGKPLDELEKRLLVEGAKAARFDRSRKKMSVGSLVHEFVDAYIKGDRPKLPMNKDVRAGVKQFLRFVKEERVTFESAEQPVYSMKHGFAGRYDWIAKVGKGRYLGDTKTGGIYLEAKLQTAAYMMALKEEHPRETFDGTLILSVRDNGKFEKEESSYLMVADHYECFLHALALYRSFSALKKGEDE